MIDNTTKIEKEIINENKPKIKHVFKLWKFVFASTKIISINISKFIHYPVNTKTYRCSILGRIYIRIRNR